MSVVEKWRSDQLRVCAESGVAPVAVRDDEKLGIASNVRTGLLPINGVRNRPQGGTCGWYIWAGEEQSTDPDFFQPLHVAHLEDWCKLALPFLLLPPGWRFLVTGEHVDVWFDPQVDLSPLTFVCPHVFANQRPVMSASRDFDDEWRLHCGCWEHAPGAGAPIELSQLIERDPSLTFIIGLARGVYAERDAPQGPWRTKGRP